ncbi:MAG: endonuclease/exonuclease/phosphatase family protein [Patescibacteria group bacterium]
MQLIVLNLWLGKVFEPLREFVLKNAKETDFFCFQEMLSGHFNTADLLDNKYNMYAVFKNLLPDFRSDFTTMQDVYSSQNKLVSSSGLAIFIKKSINVEKFGSLFTYGERNRYFLSNNTSVMPSMVQHATFSFGEKKYTIANFHGISVWPKVDSASRIKQSENISGFLKTINHSKILCGDFNLSPDTRSLAILEEDMINVVKNQNISRTRSRLLKTKEDKISDYILVSPDVIIKALAVPNVAVSDHLPLIFNFN